jgi:hypothetical protein
VNMAFADEGHHEAEELSHLHGLPKTWQARQSSMHASQDVCLFVCLHTHTHTSLKASYRCQQYNPIPSAAVRHGPAGRRGRAWRCSSRRGGRRWRSAPGQENL